MDWQAYILGLIVGTAVIITLHVTGVLPPL